MAEVRTMVFARPSAEDPIASRRSALFGKAFVMLPKHDVKRVKERARNVPVRLLGLELELLKLDQRTLEPANRSAVTLRTLSRTDEGPICGLVGRKAADLLRRGPDHARGTCRRVRRLARGST